MSADVDSDAAPSAPAFWLCPCCRLSFRSLEAFREHLERMRELVEKALAAPETWRRP